VPLEFDCGGKSGWARPYDDRRALFHIVRFSGCWAVQILWYILYALQVMLMSLHKWDGSPLDMNLPLK
jgi:hypothetical protein